MANMSSSLKQFAYEKSYGVLENLIYEIIEEADIDDRDLGYDPTGIMSKIKSGIKEALETAVYDKIHDIEEASS